jgi:WS/DGAT/MGAT family acyltransferase
MKRPEIAAFRLGAFDRATLAAEWKWRGVCADCVWLLRFEDEPPTLAELRDRIAARLPLVPLLTCVPKRTAFRLGAPYMVPDPSFDLRRHVLSVPPEFNSEAAQLEFISAELGSSIAGDRPLWSLHLAPAEGGFTLILRHPHFLADGMSGALLLRTLLGEEAGDGDIPRDLPPSRLRLTTIGLLHRARAWARATKSVRARGLRATARPAGSAAAAVTRWLRGGRPPRLRELNAPLGKHRRVASVAVPAEQVRAIASSSGCFPNEVYLAIVAGGLRRYLGRHGVAVDRLADLQVATMVDVGGQRSARRLGNHYAPVRVPLNVSERAAENRLDSVRGALAAMRQGSEVEESVALVDVMSWAPTPLVHGLAWLMTMPTASVNMIASHLAVSRGLRFRGRRPSRLCSWTFLPAGHSLNFVCQLARDEMTVNVMVDPEAIPDLDLLLADLDASREELLGAVGRGSVAVGALSGE